MEYWKDGMRGRRTINVLFPILQHSIIPCGWHKPIMLRDNAVLQKLRKLPNSGY